MFAVTAILSCVIKIRGLFKSTKWRQFENVKFEALSTRRGSDEGSLQPSLWLPKLSGILQKLAKCSTALHGPLGVAAIEFITQFLQYTALSTQPATHVAVMREAYSHHYGCQS